MNYFCSFEIFLKRDTLEEEVTIDWFSQEEISKKRSEIAEIIRHLGRPNLEKTDKLLPTLNFSTTPVRRSRRKHQSAANHDFIDADDEEDRIPPLVDKPEDSGIAASGFYGERSLRSRSGQEARQQERDRRLRQQRHEQENKVKFWNFCSII